LANRLKLTTAIEECDKAHTEADDERAFKWVIKAAEIISSGPYSISEKERALLLIVLDKRQD
jgi:hypothetical protein